MIEILQAVGVIIGARVWLSVWRWLLKTFLKYPPIKSLILATVICAGFVLLALRSHVHTLYLGALAMWAWLDYTKLKKVERQGQ